MNTRPDPQPNAEIPDASPSSSPVRSQRNSSLVPIGIGAALVAAILFVGIGTLSLMATRGMQPLTAESLAAAEKRWEERGLRDYQLDLALSGARPGPVHVEVTDGQTTAMTRDGVTPKRHAAWEAWTVPGQFETLEIDLEQHGPAAKPPHVPNSAILLVDFDPEYGYPRRYQKLVKANSLEVRWETTRFSGKF